MKYPYIAKLTADDSKLALFTVPATATALTDNFADIKIGESDSEWDERFYKNITREYLQNTWGVVESKEHAEFIVELAENAGFEQRTGLEKAYPCYFYLDEDEIYFFSQKYNASDDGEKQITIPLPPKDKIEKPDFSSPPKHFDCVCNKCGGKCCTGTCDDWIKVDNNVQTNSGLGILKLMPDRMGYCVVDIDGVYSRCKVEKLQKPKSKQELLIEELQTKLCNNNAVDNYILACDIINGEIEGLSYE